MDFLCGVSLVVLQHEVFQPSQAVADIGMADLDGHDFGS